MIRPHSSPRHVALRSMVSVALVIVVAPLGIAWHEVIGHGLVGVLSGGRLTRLQCMGVQLVPTLAWTGLNEGLGAALVLDIPSRSGEALAQLAGSVSTLLAAAIALAVLRKTHARGVPRLLLTCVGLWSLDLITFMLPSLGWQRYVWFGTTFSEPYEAALALGIPGRAFQVVTIGAGLMTFAGLFLPLREPVPRSQPQDLVRGPRSTAVLVRSMVVIAVLAAAACGAWFWHTRAAGPVAPNPPTNWRLDPGTRVQDWQDDIDVLAEELPKRHRKAFFKCKQEDFHDAAAALSDAVPGLQDEEVVVGLMKLVAMLGDAHTSMGVGTIKPPFHYFPLTVSIFADGPVIIAAREAQKHLVGCQLVRFADLPVDQAFQRVMVASAYENEAMFKEQAPRILCVPEICHAVGLIPTIDRVTIMVRDEQSRESAVELTPLAPGEKLASLPIDESKLPLSRKKKPHRNWYELLPQHHALYFRYNTCADEPDLAVATLAEQMLAAIDAQQVARVIIDLRGNGGGDSGLLASFITGLRRRAAVNRPGGVIVLIGRATSSSAHLHAVDLKARLGATLIGEPTGQKPNAYGEVRWFVLPHSQLVVRYSTKYWFTDPADHASLDPDILVPLASAEYFALEDPVLDAAIAHEPR